MPAACLGIVGATGGVGAAVVRQIAALASAQGGARGSSNLTVVAVCSSKLMLVAEGGVRSSWRQDLVAGQQGVQPCSLLELGRELCRVAAQRGQPGIIVDCTASEAAPDTYQAWMKMGLHIATPNKRFGAGPLPRFQALRALALQTGRHFKYEATVGAGLPIISTLGSFIDTGDRVTRVEGILSGTLSYIFNTFRPGLAFSGVVKTAKEQGFTEPDPREDLSGMDVARKVVILARDCGLDIELGSLALESLVPGPLAACTSVEEYLARLPEFDADMAQRASASAAAGEVLRFVGCVDVQRGSASVRVASYPVAHPFAQLSGSDNMVVFQTERYAKEPLIVRGPGAGNEVTAAGVLGDVLHITRCTSL